MLSVGAGVGHMGQGGVKTCWYHVSIDKIVDVALLFVGVLYSFFGVGEVWWSGWTGSEDAWC